MKRSTFLKRSLGLAALTLLPADELLAWHDGEIAADFDRELGAMGPELFVRLMDPDDRILGAECFPLAGWDLKSPFTFTVEAHETITAAGVRYRMEGLPGLVYVDSTDPLERYVGATAQWYSEWRLLPFLSRKKLCVGDTIDTTLTVSWEADPGHPFTGMYNDVARMVVFP